MRLKAEADRDITMAWYVAALSRQDKMPPLPTLLSSPVKRAQTRDEQRRMLQHLSEYYRIPLREVHH